MLLTGFEPATSCLEGRRSIQTELQEHKTTKKRLYLKLWFYKLYLLLTKLSF